AAEERGVAREAAAGVDADERHETAEPPPVVEGPAVEPGDTGAVGVPGPAAAALGEEDDREPPVGGQLEQAVLLPVVLHALRAGRCRVPRRRSTASGRAACSVRAWRRCTSARSGRTRAGSLCPAWPAAVGSTALSSMTTRAWPSYTVSPGLTRSARTIPPTGAVTTCSIFMASMTRSCPPAGTASPGDTSTATTVPCMGARTTTAPSATAGSPAPA